MLKLQTSTKNYWTQDFEVTPEDLEFIYNLFLETETPVKTPELIKRLIQHRIDREYQKLEKVTQQGELFQPSQSYEVGQTVIFPAFDFMQGEIIDERAGHNPDFGEFVVLKVDFEDGTQREIASHLQGEHRLNQEVSSVLNGDRPDPEEIYARYKRVLTPKVVDALRDDKDTVFIGKRWFLKTLLLDVNMAHLNLAEAILDINGGGPMQTDEIAETAEFGEDVNNILQRVSLDYGLLMDDRFDEVGPAGKVLWFLNRMEPEEIHEPPQALRYDEIPYDPGVLSEEMVLIEEQLDDELSIHQLVDEDELQAEETICLVYPHWSLGTLPLSQRSEHLFPIAYRTPRILMTLIDGQSGEEMQGWVVRDHYYVYGLSDFYRHHQLPIGTLLKLRTDPDDPSRVIVDFNAYKPRSEWVWLAYADNNRIRFKEGQMLIGAEFDDLMVLGVEDVEAFDKLRQKYENKKLVPIMVELMRELAQFSPQKHVHCKTLYSAVNLLKRCPPAPIFANLVTNSEFAHAGGPFWRLV